MITEEAMDMSLGRPLEVYIANLSVMAILFTNTLVMAYASKARDYILNPWWYEPNPKQHMENGSGTNNSWITTKTVFICQKMRNTVQAIC